MARRAKKRTGGPSYEEVWADIEERESKKPPTKKQQEQERRKKIRIEAQSEKESQTSKLNVDKVSTAIFGKEGDSIRKIHGTLSKLSGHVRKSLVRIKALESKAGKIENNIEKNSEKITRIKNILKSQKSDIGKKIPGNNKDTIEKTLIETNKILVDIKKQLILDYKKEKKDDKEKQDRDKREESKRGLKSQENLLEKTRKKLGSLIKSGVKTIIKPAADIFDKIIQAISLIGAGIATNATLEWLKDKKNIAKINEWFSWIKDNWQWMAAAVGAIALVPLVTTIAGLIGPIGTIVGLLLKGVPLLIGVLTNPVFLGFAAGAGLIFGGKALVDFFKRRGAGGEAHLSAFEALKAELAEEGINVIGSGKDEEFYLSGTGRGPGNRHQKKVADS
jgi:hypothetical protein